MSEDFSQDDFDALVGDFEDELDLTLYADAQELQEEVTVQILAAIENGLKLRGRFDLVLTGGTLGVQIADALVAELNALVTDVYARACNKLQHLLLSFRTEVALKHVS